MSNTADNRLNDFVLMQAQSAGLFLGKLPNPSTGEFKIQLPAADAIITNLEMLQDKTKGNLTQEETQLLQAALKNIKQLRLQVQASD